MQSFERFDWSTATESEQLAMAQKGNEEQLCALARKYDWSMYPETVLGWIMAQKCIDLSTALAVFLNGEPERFNYLPQRAIPRTYRETTRMLDNLCLRINCGFYLARPDRILRRRARLENWLAFQEADKAEGRQGRWVLDPAILAPVLAEQPQPQPAMQRPRMVKADPWQRLFSSAA